MRWYGIEPWQEPIISEALPDVELVPHPFTADTLQDTDVLVLRVRGSEALTRTLLNRMPSLKYVVTLSTGTDHLDLSACEARGITVHKLTDYSTESVAEHALAMLLALAHTLREPSRRPIELRGKRLGIIGAGAIGKALIRLACALEMDCLAYDIVHDDAAETLGYRYASLEDVLACDAVSLHLPLTSETTNILNKERLTMLKDGAIIINTARGGLIDTRALLDEVTRGRLLAGLDVLAVDGEEEAWRTPEADALRALPNVILTEHIAGDTREARERATKQAIELLRRLLR